MLRRPWFQSQTPQGLHKAPTEIGTLREIFTALGTPTQAAWPDAQALPNYMQFSACSGQPLSAQFPQVQVTEAWSQDVCQRAELLPEHEQRLPAVSCKKWDARACKR